jgi:hypothetical protein
LSDRSCSCTLCGKPWTVVSMAMASNGQHSATDHTAALACNKPWTLQSTWQWSAMHQHDELTGCMCILSVRQ